MHNFDTQIVINKPMKFSKKITKVVTKLKTNYIKKLILQINRYPNLVQDKHSYINNIRDNNYRNTKKLSQNFNS